VGSDGQERRPQDRYDVVVLGGGLAGLTLALQLKRARPETSVLVAEKRKGPAPEAAFKVGESTLEIGAHYFARVLGLEDHIDRDQLPKMGVRFWFPAGDNEDLTRRAEYGPPFRPATPTYQLARGRFENELARRNLEAGVDLFDGARVEEVDLGGEQHRVTVSRDGETWKLSTRWVVGATGRASLLRRKLGLDKDAPHAINSAWFRLRGGLDIETWSDEPDFLGRMSERGLRGLSTNHLLDEGYWVWLIPLSSGEISIGIVADPRYHPFERINTLDGALDWLREHEPQLSAALDGRREQIDDFLKVEHYSHGCKRVFSPDRWCVTGDAGAFLDPLFSPGSDFIGMSNSLITDLIVTDLSGKPIDDRAEFSNDFYLRYFDAWLSHYQDLYPLFGNLLATTVMFSWYRMSYFGVPVLLFYEGKLSDPDFLAGIEDEMDRFIRLVPRVERMIREWHGLEQAGAEGVLIRPAEFEYIGQIMGDLAASRGQAGAAFDDATLKAKIAERMRKLEAAAVTLFHEAASRLPAGSIDPDAKINPYAVGLQPDRWEADGLFDGSGMTIAEAGAEARGIAERVDDLRAGRGAPAGPPPSGPPGGPPGVGAYP
jgi:flavin-dependent dehydrogenase